MPPAKIPNLRPYKKEIPKDYTSAMRSTSRFHRKTTVSRRQAQGRRSRRAWTAVLRSLLHGKGLWIGLLLVTAFYAWIFYTFFVGPTAFRWKAIYGDANYPGGYEIRGIDISHYQGDIDWDRLRGATIEGCPLRFVMIKATEGSTKLDENFADNFYQAREHGFIRGAYHFWSNKSSARDQAYHFLSKVHLEPGDLPPVLDVEHMPAGKKVEDFQRDLLTWLHIVEDRYHVKPILYTYYKFKEKYLNAPVFDDYPYWIAHYYVDKVEYKGAWKFWQHTDAGRVSGIKGYVDIDIYNGSFYDMKELTIPSPDEEDNW